MTQTEIDQLTDWVNADLFETPYPVVNERTAEGWKNRISQFLETIVFIHKGIERTQKLTAFRDRIRFLFIQRMVEEGYPAGLNMGSSIGNAATQFNLKLKGQTGTGASGRSATLMDDLKLLLAASDNPRNQTNIIRFREKTSIIKLYQSRRFYQSVTLGIPGMLKPEVYHYDEVEDDSDWYSFFEEIYNVEIPQDQFCLRLTLDVQLLYNFQLSLNEIARSIRLEFDNFIIVPSPQHIGIIDLYPLEIPHREDQEESEGEEEEEEEEEEIENDRVEIIVDDEGLEEADEDVIPESVPPRSEPDKIPIYEQDFIKLSDRRFGTDQYFYLMNEVLARIKEIEFGDLPEVNDAVIIWDSMLAFIKKEKKLGPNTWRLELSERVRKDLGFLPRHFKTFFSSRVSDGKPLWKVEPESEGKMIYRMIFRGSGKPKAPTQVISEALDSNVDFDMVSIASYELAGGFESCILRPNVDQRRSTTSVDKTAERLFGIQNAEANIYRRSRSLFSGQHYVSIIHMSLLASFICATGRVLPINRHGQAKLKAPIASATFEEQLSNIVNASLFSKTEALTTATALLTGQRPALGTGAIVTKVSSAYLEAEKNVVQKPIPEAKIEEDIGDILDELEKSEGIVEAPLPINPISIAPSVERKPKADKEGAPNTSGFAVRNIKSRSDLTKSVVIEGDLQGAVPARRAQGKLEGEEAPPMVGIKGRVIKVDDLSGKTRTSAPEPKHVLRGLVGKRSILPNDT